MIHEIMRSRRSVRRFKPEMPARHLIRQLIESAITAPSASNKQPWRFLVVANRDVMERLAAAVRDAVERIARHIDPTRESAVRDYGDYFTRFQEAPVMIVPLCRSLTVLSNLMSENAPPEERDHIDVMEKNSGLISASLAMQNLLLRAHSLGLGASGMTGPLVARERIREILGIPPSWEIVAFIPVGFPAETPRPTQRKSVDSVWRWID